MYYICHLIRHAVQLTGGEPGEGRHTGEDIQDDGAAQVGGRYVQLRQAGGLVPLGLADLFPLQPGLLQEEAGQVFTALQQDLQTAAGHLKPRGELSESVTLCQSQLTLGQ